MLPQAFLSDSEQLYTDNTIGLLDKHAGRRASARGKWGKNLSVVDNARNLSRSGKRYYGHSAGEGAQGVAHCRGRYADMFPNPGRTIYSTSCGTPSSSGEDDSNPLYTYQVPDLSKPIPQLYEADGLCHYIEWSEIDERCSDSATEGRVQVESLATTLYFKGVEEPELSSSICDFEDENDGQELVEVSTQGIATRPSSPGPSPSSSSSASSSFWDIASQFGADTDATSVASDCDEEDEVDEETRTCEKYFKQYINQELCGTDSW